MSINRRSFLKTSFLSALQIGALSSFTHWDTLAKTKNALPRATPESMGSSSASILKFIQAIEHSGVHSMMLVKNGRVITEGWWEPYAPDLKHTLYSLSKSFTSTAIGFAQQEGKLSVQDKVISFFPDQLPAVVSENLAAMRIHDLLAMATGHTKDTLNNIREDVDGNWIKSFLAQEVPKTPGTHFLYNSGATYMLAAILKKVTQQNVSEYLTPRLFKPLGITDFDWETDSQGIEVGGWGLRVTTEAIAKFGQLYLQEGKWNNQQLLSKEWIQEATKQQILQPGKEEDRPNSDWLQGYGYQFWRCRNNAYRGDGAYGQYCVVFPEQQMVLAITSELPDMQGILNRAWEFLMTPQPGVTTSKQLQAYTKQLALPLPKGATTSPVASQLNQRIYQLDSNPLNLTQITFHWVKNDMAFHLKDNKGSHRIAFAVNDWKKSSTTWSMEWLKLIATKIPNQPPLQTASAALWKTPKQLEVTLRFIDTAHYTRLLFEFEEDKIAVHFFKSTSLMSNQQEPSFSINGKRL